ncbi:hypothetical protein SERLADRAFT_397367 [Serpula lacrymans var. lacrymans S7.9]|uniref:Uncharacterized protein n=1 Tax=Serpula lacrymans var. lacrymans (strain S7.9) TaxID=578457 RepID=F8P5I0_SERL9|nr:uncharacterized protein SERLADRAFT_397367 [Serpula lacrymans var. lacrymans S7.9]EGO21867.1 hypothetical protein SERLADRAFT_397367 [Serpula lacrymans var. lacrymans S7.9]
MWVTYSTSAVQSTCMPKCGMLMFAEKYLTVTWKTNRLMDERLHLQHGRKT